MANNLPKILRPFVSHGFILQGETDTQYYGICPFTGSEGKFYVNKKSGLWDSKTCGKSGNIFTFLNEISNVYRNDITSLDLNTLSEDRGIPFSIFLQYEIGKSSDSFTFPTRNSKGQIIDIRSYKIGGSFRSTAECSVGLFGLSKLVQSDATKNNAIFLCEGEWDCMAVQWMLQEAEFDGIALGLPGAGTLKREWLPYFQDRIVYCLYDHDQAGREGEEKFRNQFSSVTKKTYYCHWNEKEKEGYDARDFILESLKIKRKSAKDTLASLVELFSSKPRSEGSHAKILNEADSKSSESINPEFDNRPASLQDLFRVFSKWLKLDNFWTLEISLAVIMSEKLDGDPLWMFLVGPPGSGKTEIVQSAKYYKNVKLVSSITPKSLVSGSDLDGVDPSLIPHLNHKTVIMKDFTSILGKPAMEREEILSILRECYDGQYVKFFGNGVVREYHPHFSILAAVTPRIHAFAEKESMLGERFMKFSVGDVSDEFEEEICIRAIQNQSKSSIMKEELANIMNRFLCAREKDPFPNITAEMARKIAKLSMVAAWLRGTIDRNSYRPDIIEARPFREMGSRISFQLSKLARSLARVRGKKEVSDYEYFFCKKVVIDTVSQRCEDIVRVMYLNTSKRGDALSSARMSNLTRYPEPTVRRISDDMVMMGIFKGLGKGMQYRYYLTEEAKSSLDICELYANLDELKILTNKEGEVKSTKKFKAVISTNGKAKSSPTIKLKLQSPTNKRKV